MARRRAAAAGRRAARPRASRVGRATPRRWRACVGGCAGAGARSTSPIRACGCATTSTRRTATTSTSTRRADVRAPRRRRHGAAAWARCRQRRAAPDDYERGARARCTPGSTRLAAARRARPRAAGSPRAPCRVPAAQRRRPRAAARPAPSRACSRWRSAASTARPRAGARRPAGSGAAPRRRCAAMGEVVVRLRRRRRHVIFGHTHRAGPMAGRRRASGRAGRRRSSSTPAAGSYETHFLGGDPRANPYWPGGRACRRRRGPAAARAAARDRAGRRSAWG